MYGVDPAHRFRLFDRSYIEVDDRRLAAAADEHAFKRLVLVRVDLLVGHVRRHVNEVAGTGFRGVLERLTPAHPRAPADDVDDALEVPVMVRARFRVGPNRDRAGPNFLRADARVRDRRGPIHALGLWDVRIELRTRNDPHALLFPILHRVTSSTTRVFDGP